MEELTPAEQLELLRRTEKQGTAAQNARMNELLRSEWRRSPAGGDDKVAPRDLDHAQIFRAWRKDMAEGSLLYSAKTKRRLRPGTVPSVAERLGMAKPDLMRARKRLGIPTWPPPPPPPPPCHCGHPFKDHEPRTLRCAVKGCAC